MYAKYIVKICEKLYFVSYFVEINIISCYVDVFFNVASFLFFDTGLIGPAIWDLLTPPFQIQMNVLIIKGPILFLWNTLSLLKTLNDECVKLEMIQKKFF